MYPLTAADYRTLGEMIFFSQDSRELRLVETNPTSRKRNNLERNFNAADHVASSYQQRGPRPCSILLFHGTLIERRLLLLLRRNVDAKRKGKISIDSRKVKDD